MDNYSLADIAAATRNNDDNGFGIGSGGGIFFLATAAGQGDAGQEQGKQQGDAFLHGTFLGANCA